MIDTAATLFQRQGYAATGWRQVVAESDTPWGSQAHHFPGGKEQLAAAALAHAGAGYERLVRQAFAREHPADAIRSWASLAGQVLAGTGWSDGCPVATVTLERAHESDAIGDVCHTVLASWQAAIADGLIAAGCENERAGRLATLALASIEGALVLARSERSPRPLDVIGDELAELFETAVPRSVDP